MVKCFLKILIKLPYHSTEAIKVEDLELNNSNFALACWENLQNVMTILQFSLVLLAISFRTCLSEKP